MAGCLADPSSGTEADPSPKRPTPTSETASSTETPATYHNPVFERVFLDPGLVRVGEAVHAYGTHQTWDDGRTRRLVPILRTTNLTD